MNLKIFVVLIFFFQLNCGTNAPAENSNQENNEVVKEEKTLQVGAARLDAYLPLIKDEAVALLVNQTSTIGDTHLVDTLLASGVNIVRIFSPEHGFRGTADAGEKITDSRDPQTGIQLVSLYGKKRKPGAEDLAGIDRVIFDIQDVGARFYTYISSMHYVMEACAEQGVKFMVLDRPNPNGHYVDGPVRQAEYESFVGKHPIPVVHGMTVGEYAQMVNGEGWLDNGVKCELEVIACANYDHDMVYELPIKPSPNLPNYRSVLLYPSICFFEGTVASLGRGTNKQFQVLGHPDYTAGDYTFTPQSMPGAKHPPLLGKTCNGYDLTTIDPMQIKAEARINLSYLIDFYKNFPDQDNFFLKNNWIDKLAGGPELQAQIKAGKSEDEIRASWEDDLTAFKTIRAKYLLY